MWAFSVLSTSAQVGSNEDHLKVVMRTIGHELLLLSGDSSSRVLPIQANGNQYRIEFENDFEFDPGFLAATINNVADRSEILESYHVAVDSCESDKTVYSFEMQKRENADLLPCKGRIQPKGCYSIVVTVMDDGGESLIAETNGAGGDPTETKTAKTEVIVLVMLLVAIVIALLLYFRKRKTKSPDSSHLIKIGNYEFDQRNMELSFDNRKIELTGKEADLLFLLHSSANSTLERDEILKNVWGDEGDYIGRTLDVFISKLRKKLEGDQNIRIVNIRGVGYKLVLNKN
ncbi:winged helix-turn-helix domain-containing protein [Halocola ammonii]